MFATSNGFPMLYLATALGWQDGVGGLRGEGAQGTEGYHRLIWSLRLHGHVLWEHIRDVIPGVTVQTLLQPLLVQIVSWGETSRRSVWVKKVFALSQTNPQCSIWILKHMTHINKKTGSPMNPMLRPRTKMPFRAPISTNSSASSLPRSWRTPRRQS